MAQIMPLSLVMIVAGALVAGLGSLELIILGLRKAPEGYEDKRGFQAVRKGALGTGSLVSHRAARPSFLLSRFRRWLYQMAAPYCKRAGARRKCARRLTFVREAIHLLL
jgi:hypothetical protein